MSIIQGTSKSSAAGYSINQSLRFARGDSPQLTGGTGQTGSATTFTIAMWIKRAEIAGNNLTIWSAGDGSSKRAMARFVSGGGSSVAEDINFSVRTGGAFYELNANVSNRDPAAWTHYQWFWDTTNSTAADRMRLYIGGERITSFTNTLSNPGSSLAIDSWNVSSFAHQIGFENSARHLDGYIAEAYHIDGSALEPSSFTETHGDGYLIPKKYIGSFGTRGWYLKFEDSSDLGNDSSGNNNDFTSSGLTSADQVSDSPTDNFITWNPLVNPGGGTAGTFSNGNLDFTAGGDNGRAGTIFQSSGKWYVEWEIIGSGANCMVGIVSESVVASSDMVDDTASSGLDKYGGDRDVCSYYGTTGAIFLATSNPSYGDSYANGDIIGMALDLDNGAVWFSKNGTWQNSATIAEIEAGTTTNAARTGLDNNFTLHFHQFDGTSGARINAGQAAFTYTQPTGFSK